MSRIRMTASRAGAPRGSMFDTRIDEIGDEVITDHGGGDRSVIGMLQVGACVRIDEEPSNADVALECVKRAAAASIISGAGANGVLCDMLRSVWGLKCVSRTVVDFVAV